MLYHFFINILYFQLTRNELSVLPSEMGDLSNLSELAVDLNADLTSLPDSFSGLQALATFSVITNIFHIII